jgi:cobalt/nickel transport system ATP-binding protein
LGDDLSTVRALEIADLTYRYPDGTVALSELSLAVNRDERVAVLGANGAGKSTLFLHLTGVLQASKQNKFECFGEPLNKKTIKSIRRKVGLVFQNPDDQLFCPNIYEDIAFGPRNLGMSESEVETRVKEAMSAVGIEGFEERSAFHLSLGQKKRAAIATVLAMNCELLALDEPTSSLDPRGRREIIELLEKLGGTQLIVTHDLALARRLCHRVIILAKGEKVADGTPADILDDQDLLMKHHLV